MRPCTGRPPMLNASVSPSLSPSVVARPDSTLRPSSPAGALPQRPATISLWAGAAPAWLRLNSRSARRWARSSAKRRACTASPPMAVSRPRIIGYQSKRSTPAPVSVARKASLWSGWMLMTKRSGAAAGVARRQLSIRSVRSRTSRARASMPTASEATCMTANHGRAATWRVASSSQRGRPAPLTLTGTSRRNSPTAAQASSPNRSTAPAKPAAAMAPSFRSSASTTRMAARPATPAPSTSSDPALGAPRSRRITRSGGTAASCNTGGRPKPSSSDSPNPRPSSAGQALGGGRSTSIRPASSDTKTWCKPRPPSAPARLALRPASRNSRP
mmetsp:Transcript_12878/g.30316  ORF Transcript_12878/g.30316 Transcript_12878/m.30316 type:complete len:330 (+) Transcript_12878:808-1797(+)